MGSKKVQVDEEPCLCAGGSIFELMFVQAVATVAWIIYAAGRVYSYYLAARDRLIAVAILLGESRSTAITGVMKTMRRTAMISFAT